MSSWTLKSELRENDQGQFAEGLHSKIMQDVSTVEDKFSFHGSH